MILPIKFLITRFPHGAGGKFLSTILQTSIDVDHWNHVIENHKNHKLFYDLNLAYVNRSFSANPAEHMQKEPIAPYDTSLFSSTYNRGNDVTKKEILDHARAINDHFLLDACIQEKYINLVINKPNFPKFCENSPAITITTESDSEINWLRTTLWNKHFLEDQENIYYLPEHPMYCSFKSLPKILEYNNKSVFSSADKEKIINEKIINNQMLQFYQNKQNFLESENNYFIPLSSFFNVNDFSAHIEHIFNKFNLRGLDLQLINDLHKIWLSRQIKYDDNYI
jgi:hypothetical protein